MVRSETKVIAEVDKKVEAQAKARHGLLDKIKTNYDLITQLKEADKKALMEIDETDAKINTTKSSLYKELGKQVKENDAFQEKMWNQINKLKDKISDLYFQVNEEEEEESEETSFAEDEDIEDEISEKRDELKVAESPKRLSEKPEEEDRATASRPNESKRGDVTLQFPSEVKERHPPI